MIDFIDVCEIRHVGYEEYWRKYLCVNEDYIKRFLDALASPALMYESWMDIQI